MKHTKLFAIILFMALFSISCGGGSLGSNGADSSGSSDGSSIAMQMEALRSIDAVIDNMDVTESDPAFASENLLQLPSIYKEAGGGGNDGESEKDDGFQSGVITAQLLRHNTLQAFMRSEVFLRFLEASLEAGEISADDVAGLSGHIAGLLGDGNLSIEAISNEYETDEFEVLVNACSNGIPHNRVIIRPSDGMNKTKVIFLGETDDMWIRAVALVGESRADTKIMGCMTDREGYFNCMEFHFDDSGNGVTALTGDWIGIDKGDKSTISISGTLTSRVGWTDTKLWVEDEKGSFGIAGKISTPDGNEVKDVQKLPSKPDGIMNLSEMIAANDILSGIDLLAPLNGVSLESLIAMNSTDTSTLFRSWNGELQSCPSLEDTESLPSNLERATRVAATRHNKQRKPEKDSRAMLEAFRGGSNSSGNNGCDGTMDDGFCFPSLGGSVNSCDQIEGEYYYTGDDDDFNTITMSEWLGAEHMDPNRIYHYTIEDCNIVSDDSMTIKILAGGPTAIEASVFKISKDDDQRAFLTSRYSEGSDVAQLPFACEDGTTIINHDKFPGDSCSGVNPFVSVKVRIQRGNDGKVEFFLYNFKDALGNEATDTVARFIMHVGDDEGGDEGNDGPDTWGAASLITVGNACETAEGMYAYLVPNRLGSKSSVGDLLLDDGLGGTGWFDLTKFLDMGQTRFIEDDISSGRLCVVCGVNGTLDDMWIRDCKSRFTLENIRSAPPVLFTQNALELHNGNGNSSYIQNFDGEGGGGELQKWVRANNDYANSFRHTEVGEMAMHFRIEKTSQVDYIFLSGDDADVHMYLYRMWDAAADMADDGNYNGSGGSIHDDTIFDFVRVADLPSTLFCYDQNNALDPFCYTWLQGTDGDGKSCDYHVADAGNTVVAPESPSSGETFDYDILKAHFMDSEEGLGMIDPEADAFITCLTNYSGNDSDIKTILKDNKCVPFELLDDTGLAWLACRQ